MSTGETDVVERLVLWAEADLRELARDIRVMGLKVEPDELHKWADLMDEAATEITRLRSQGAVPEGWVVEIGNAEKLYLSSFSISDEISTAFSPDIKDGIRFARESDANYCAENLLADDSEYRAVRLPASPPPTQGGGDSRIRELLETALELFECDDECNTPGTDAWAWTYHVRDALKTVSPPASAAQQEGDAQSIADALFAEQERDGGISEAQIREAISTAVAAERARVIQECARLAEGDAYRERYRTFRFRLSGDFGTDSRIVEHADATAAAIRALGKGGADV